MSIICSTSGQQRKIIMFSFRPPFTTSCSNQKTLEGTKTEKTCLCLSHIWYCNRDLSHEKTGAFCQFEVRLFNLEFSQQNKDSFISQDFKFNFLSWDSRKKNGIRDKKEAKKQLVKVADLIVSTIFTTISFSSLDFLSVKAVALYGN